MKTNGEAQVKRLRAGAVPADDLTFRWESDDQAIRFRDASAKLFGGEVSGSFDVPIRDDAAGTGSLKLENIDLGELSKGLMAGGTLKLEGRAAGTIKLRSPAAGEGKPRGHGRRGPGGAEHEAPGHRGQEDQGDGGLPRRACSSTR